MKKLYLTLALAVLCILGLGGRAHAQEPDGIVVKVPFDFFVGAQAMPAGKYTFGRLFSSQRSSFILHGDATSAVVFPTSSEETSTFNSNLVFEHLGDKYYLGKIKTPAGIYNIATPRPMLALARANDRNIVTVGGTN
jgi:hypothetical protein